MHERVKCLGSDATAEFLDHLLLLGMIEQSVFVYEVSHIDFQPCHLCTEISPDVLNLLMVSCPVDDDTFTNVH